MATTVPPSRLCSVHAIHKDPRWSTIWNASRGDAVVLADPGFAAPCPARRAKHHSGRLTVTEVGAGVVRPRILSTSAATLRTTPTRARSGLNPAAIIACATAILALATDASSRVRLEIETLRQGGPETLAGLPGCAGRATIPLELALSAWIPYLRPTRKTPRRKEGGGICSLWEPFLYTIRVRKSRR